MQFLYYYQIILAFFMYFNVFAGFRTHRHLLAVLPPLDFRPARNAFPNPLHSFPKFPSHSTKPFRTSPYSFLHPQQNLKSHFDSYKSRHDL